MLKRIRNLWLERINPALIRFLLFITKGEILYVSFALIIMIIIVIVALYFHNDLNNVIELSTFSALVFEKILFGIVGLLIAFLHSFTEDPDKLSTRYPKLVERYSSEPSFVWLRNRPQNGLEIIPVIHVAWLYDKPIAIEDHPEQEYMLPEIIDKHYDELFNTHATSKIYNNTNVRVVDWGVDNDTGKFVIKTGRTSYYNSLVTNRAMDYELKKGVTVRELLECGPMVHPLKYSNLSNHIGFNGFVESSDNKVIFVKRNKDVSIGKRTWANSVGASLKAEYGLDERYMFFRGWPIQRNYP